MILLFGCFVVATKTWTMGIICHRTRIRPPVIRKQKPSHKQKNPEKKKERKKNRINPSRNGSSPSWLLTHTALQYMGYPYYDPISANETADISIFLFSPFPSNPQRPKRDESSISKRVARPETSADLVYGLLSERRRIDHQSLTSK